MIFLKHFAYLPETAISRNTSELLLPNYLPTNLVPNKLYQKSTGVGKSEKNWKCKYTTPENWNILSQCPMRYTQFLVSFNCCRLYHIEPKTKNISYYYYFYFPKVFLLLLLENVVASFLICISAKSTNFKYCLFNQNWNSLPQNKCFLYLKLFLILQQCNFAALCNSDSMLWGKIHPEFWNQKFFISKSWVYAP